MAERKVRNELPVAAFARRGAQGRRGRGEAGDAVNRPQPFGQMQARLATAERQLSREIAIETERLNRQHRVGRAVEVERRVVRGEEGFVPPTGGAPAGARRRRSPRHRRPGPHPRRDGRTEPTAARCRPPAPRAPARLCQTSSPAGRRTSGTRRYSVAVWVSGTGSQACGKEIDHRRAAEGERVDADNPFELRGGAIEINKNSRRPPAGNQRLRLDACQVDKQKLLGKGEILGQQPEAGEAAGGPGEQCLIRRKADRLDRFGRQRRPAPDRPVHPQGDTDAWPQSSS